MTEEEAKTKWCPFARVLVESAEEETASPVAGANRLETRGSGEPDLEWKTPRCIGSACMAWRWTERGRVEALAPGAGRYRMYARENDVPLGYQKRPVPDEGYCGLAGSPS